MPVVNFQGDKIEFPYNMMDEEIYDVLNGLMAAGTAVVEVGSVIGSASVAEPVAGLTALATGDSDAVEGMKSRMTYKPHTEVGKRAMERLGQDMQALSDAAGLDKMSGYWRDRVVPALQEQAGPIGGSALAAAGLAAITALGEASPGGKAAGASRRFGTGEGGAIKAFHGSPHDFEEFKMSQIGTGAGAQVYGHGLYFADDIEVAKSYQPRSIKAEEMMMQRYEQAEAVQDYKTMEAWEQAMMHETPAQIRATGVDMGDKAYESAFNAVADELDTFPREGALMQVNIDATPDELLDWDKPLSEQSEKVKNLIDDYAPAVTQGDIKKHLAEMPDPTGDWDTFEKWQDARKAMHRRQEIGISDNTLGSSFVQGKKAGYGDALEHMKKGGIKGIKYKDGFSSGAEGGTSNYVIFDERLISIAKKYGLSIPAAAALLAEQTDEDTSGMYQEGM